MMRPSLESSIVRGGRIQPLKANLFKPQKKPSHFNQSLISNFDLVEYSDKVCDAILNESDDMLVVFIKDLAIPRFPCVAMFLVGKAVFLIVLAFCLDSPVLRRNSAGLTFLMSKRLPKAVPPLPFHSTHVLQFLEELVFLLHS